MEIENKLWPHLKTAIEGLSEMMRDREHQVTSCYKWERLKYLATIRLAVSICDTYARDCEKAILEEEDIRCLHEEVVELDVE
jgi:hypothetical protein